MTDKIYKSLSELRSAVELAGVRVRQPKGLSRLARFAEGAGVRFETPIMLHTLPGPVKEIGRHTFIGTNPDFENTPTIGAYCAIAADIKIGKSEHPTNYLSVNSLFYGTSPPTVFMEEDRAWLEGRAGLNLLALDDFRPKINAKCRIGNDVWIGTGAVIRRGVTIGDGAIVGASAVVVKDVEPYEIVGGVPAKHIRYRFDEETIERLLAVRWWEMPQRLLNDIDARDVAGSLAKLERRRSMLTKIVREGVKITKVEGGYALSQWRSIKSV